VGSAFGYSSEGFVVGALACNGALTCLTRSETAVASAAQGVLNAATELGHVVDLDTAEELGLEAMRRIQVRLCVGAGAVVAGYAIKKSLDS
jgi:hypothetical protein